MAQDRRELLDLLKFELRFLEDGGYGRSPHTPWRRQLVFADSPTCPNFNDPARPHPCTECLLMRFVPSELRDQPSPCRLIPLTDKGETIDYFYRCGTQLELEEALAGWLRKQICQIEEQDEAAPAAKHSGDIPNGMDRTRRQQWLAMAGNLYLLANRHRENENYVVANALYDLALEVAEKVARVRTDQQAAFEMAHRGENGGEQAPLEKAKTDSTKTNAFVR